MWSDLNPLFGGKSNITMALEVRETGDPLSTPFTGKSASFATCRYLENYPLSRLKALEEEARKAFESGMQTRSDDRKRDHQGNKPTSSFPISKELQEAPYSSCLPLVPPKKLPCSVLTLELSFSRKSPRKVRHKKISRKPESSA